MKEKRYLIGSEDDFLGIGFFMGFSEKTKSPTFSSGIWGGTRIYKTFSGAERAMKRILEEMARIYRRGTIKEEKEKGPAP